MNISKMKEKIKTRAQKMKTERKSKTKCNFYLCSNQQMLSEAYLFSNNFHRRHRWTNDRIRKKTHTQHEYINRDVKELNKVL